MPFAVGDKVAWGDVAYPHASGSVLRADAVGDAPVGVVKDAANEEGTWYTVTFDDGDKVLTQDELVKVADE